MKMCTCLPRLHGSLGLGLLSLQTVSTEYAGPVFGKTLLVVVDAHSKGPDICVMTYFGQYYSSATGYVCQVRPINKASV